MLPTVQDIVQETRLINMSLQGLPSKNVSAPDGYSSAVWIVLFAIVISVSIIVNTAYVATLLCRRNITIVHLTLVFFFLVNLVDYGLLIFEFYGDPATKYPYTELSCVFYQSILHSCSLLRSGALVMLVFQAFFLSYGAPCPKQSSLLVILLIFSQVILVIPSLLYSRLLVYPDSQVCVMDLSSLARVTGSGGGRDYTLNAVFFLIYKSVLTYWLPLVLVLYPLIKMVKIVNSVTDTEYTVTITFAVTISFLVFYLPLAVTVMARELVTILNIPASSTTVWVINVFHSLSLLISFFFHIFRPLVCLVIDQDSRPNLCRRRYRQVEKDGEGNGQV